MAFTYQTRQLAEDMAQHSADFYRTAFAVFSGRVFRSAPVTCTCPVDWLECTADDLLVIYEPRA